MAMASLSNTDNFSIWLKKKLVDLNTDDEVFSPYILGILESDDSEEEKREALFGILSEITENDISDICNEIIKNWLKTAEENSKEEEKTVEKIDVEQKLAKLLEESKVQSVQVTSKISKEKQKLKDAILAQYAEVSDGDDGVEEESEDLSSAGYVKNMNAEVVARAEREKREKEKEEAYKKKEKDKEDRAKQKSKDDERKEKEKKRTQKGERRR
ncbi:Coiled-coil domain-containing protein 43 [Armadillidium nasatum]|uniref:Coiled-coil domain-containing protein 43 n=1 Tax=Armadillidium nasatum TaxID=96803 RepID=A0A5N5TBQ2_9CRUS|nr:Coiled-coil domain-containing protein 43 [Armadillidium nasatum]